MADEQLVATNTTDSTRRWLESFIAAEYSLQGSRLNRNLRNMFCVTCMEGTLNASDFKVGQPHTGHPYLQVRKHTYRGHVVNADDLAKFIDTACLQPYQANSVLTFSLRTRQDVPLMRTPSQQRHFCANCNNTLSSDSPLVNVCSVECLLRSSPLTVKPAAPTVMEPPKRRYDQAGSSSLKLQDWRTGKTTDEGEGASKCAEDGEQELNATAEEEKTTLMLVQDVQARSEVEPENIKRSGAQSEVRSALAERMWNRARKATVDATSEQNPRFNGNDVERVRRVGSHARFMLSILSSSTSCEDRQGTPTQLPNGLQIHFLTAQPPADIIHAVAETAVVVNNATQRPADIIHAATENVGAVNNATQPLDIDAIAEINETSIADILASTRH